MMATDGVAGKSLRRHSHHFFKLMLQSSINDKKLGIPGKFVEEFGDELSDIATLTVPNGRVWKIGLTKSDKNVWFDDNWQEFVEYYSIGFGFFLLFRYEGGSNFHVVICDVNTCEINYPCHIPSAEEQSNHNEQSLPLHELEFCNSTENLGSPSQCPSHGSLVNRIVGECEGGDRDRVIIREQSNHNKQSFHRDVEVHDNVDSLVNRIVGDSMDRDNSCSKKSKIGDQVATGPDNSSRPSLLNDAENVDATKNTGHRARKLKPRRPVDELGSKPKKTKKFDERVLLGKDAEELEKYGRKRFSFKSLSLRRPVTEEEKEGALQRARRFRSNNPNFLVILKNHHKYNAHVNVPSDFSNNHMSNVSESIQLEVGNRRWEVRCYPISKKNRALIITKGWNVFYKENFLEENDVCVFELKPGDDVVLQVTIFRVVET